MVGERDREIEAGVCVGDMNWARETFFWRKEVGRREWSCVGMRGEVTLGD